MYLKGLAKMKYAFSRDDYNGTNNLNRALMESINGALDFHWNYVQELNDILTTTNDVYIVVLKSGMKRRYGIYTLSRLGCIRKERGLFRRLDTTRIHITEDISWKVLAKFLPLLKIDWTGKDVEHL